MKQWKISLETSILYLREKGDKLTFESKKEKKIGGNERLDYWIDCIEEKCHWKRNASCKFKQSHKLSVKGTQW